MNRNTSGSGNASDGTSFSGPPKNADNEADLLAREQRLAQAAVKRSLGDIAADLKTIADVRNWARRYPWAATGAAGAAGLGAGLGLGGGKHKRWAESEPATWSQDDREREPRKGRAGFSVWPFVFDLLKLAIQSAVTSASAAGAAVASSETVATETAEQVARGNSPANGA